MTVIEGSDAILRVRTTAGTGILISVTNAASSSTAERGTLPVERRANDEFDAWLLQRDLDGFEALDESDYADQETALQALDQIDT